MIGFFLEGDVGVIRLQRPDKRNALTPEALEQLAGAGAWLEDPAAPLFPARALLLCGEGPAFCAGFDLDTCRGEGGEGGNGGDAALSRLLRGLSAAIVALRAQERPVVLAAHGAAIAGGCALLGAADVVVVDAGAKLGYPVARLGISPAVSAPFLLPAIGDDAARVRLLDPGLIDGREALRLGLAHELVEQAEDVLPRAAAIAHDLAAKPGEGARATRRWLHDITATATAPLRGLEVSESLVGSAASRARLQAMWTSRENR